MPLCGHVFMIINSGFTNIEQSSFSTVQRKALAQVMRQLSIKTPLHQSYRDKGWLFPFNKKIDLTLSEWQIESSSSRQERDHSMLRMEAQSKKTAIKITSLLFLLVMEQSAQYLYLCGKTPYVVLSCKRFDNRTVDFVQLINSSRLNEK